MKIIECPRDAMQGIPSFIPTEKKIQYLNQLLKVGFDTLDFGSFVSPKLVPQMKDSAEVLQRLNLENTETKLLAIVANLRGAEEASIFSSIRYLGFPLSISETFQQRNTNKSIDQAFTVVGEIQNVCQKTDKEMVVYLSMGFGNPYNDPYNVDIVLDFIERLQNLGIQTISLSDTIGVASTEAVSSLVKSTLSAFSDIEIGVHLHSTLSEASDKIAAAYKAGCRRFDGALKGFGGCPMAKDELVGNMPTETIVDYLRTQQEDLKINEIEFNASLQLVNNIFIA